MINLPENLSWWENFGGNHYTNILKCYWLTYLNKYVFCHCGTNLWFWLKTDFLYMYMYYFSWENVNPIFMLDNFIYVIQNWILNASNLIIHDCNVCEGMNMQKIEREINEKSMKMIKLHNKINNIFIGLCFSKMNKWMNGWFVYYIYFIHKQIAITKQQLLIKIMYLHTNCNDFNLQFATNIIETSHIININSFNFSNYYPDFSILFCCVHKYVPIYRYHDRCWCFWQIDVDCNVKWLAKWNACVFIWNVKHANKHKLSTHISDYYKIQK